MNVIKFTASLCAILLMVAGTASAANIEIQFTGLDLELAGGDLTDATLPNSVGAGSPAQADPLTTVSFLQDGVLVGTLNSDIYADIFINDVLNIPVAGGVVTSGGNNNSFGFDILTSSSTPGWGLGLQINTFQLFYAGGEIAMAATGVASQVFAQTLPFGLQINPSDSVSIVVSSTNLDNVTSAGGFLSGFEASGTGSIRGTAVPEPSSVALAGIGAIGLAIAAVRKRNSR